MKNNVGLKKKKKITLAEIVSYTIAIILSIAFLVPMIIVVSASFSNEMDIMKYGYRLFPLKFDLGAYKYVFKNPKIMLDAYKVTITYSLISMVVSVFIQAMMAYPLSKRNLKGKGVLSFYLYFTCLFSGGLIPSYLLNTRYLHLDDTIWIYIVPGLISSYNIFMMRSFFQDVPYEISESAIIDGANEYMLFFNFMLPLSKPVRATIAFSTFLGGWNNWYTSLLYIDDQSLISLQYLLQRILQNIEILKNSSMNAVDVASVDIPSETARMAMAVIAAGPALVIFPLFQKYLVKGLTVGSVKG